MIETRDPIVDTIGPIVANRRGAPVLVLYHSQPIARLSRVSYRDADRCPLRDLVWKINVELVIALDKSGSFAFDPDGRNAQLSEIKVDHSEVFFSDQNPDIGGCGHDFRKRIVQSQSDLKMKRLPRVYQTLMPVRVYGGKRDRDDNQRQNCSPDFTE